MSDKYFSIAYEILQECPFQCEVCNRRFVKGEKRLNSQQRRLMVDNLLKKGLKRLTITGGEPAILGEELFEFIEYAHSKGVHTCLSTTGHLLNRDRVRKLDRCLDQFLLSIPTLEKDEWRNYFGPIAISDTLFDTVTNLLEWVKETDIITEVCTVLTRNTLQKVIALGHKLSAINSNIIWRIEDYYANGINGSMRHLHEISVEESNLVRENIKSIFADKFSFIYFSIQNREEAPDIFITPTGEMVTTSHNTYSQPLGNVLDEHLDYDFKMRRAWKDYEKYCRVWR